MRSHVHQWLFGDLDTARLLDMDERLQSVSRQAMGILAVALLVCVPWLGPWTLPPLALAMVTFRIAHVRARTSKHREYVLLGAWLSAETIIAFCVALTGGPRVATITWLALPIVTLAARFNGRVVAVGSGISLLLLAAVCLATDFHAVLAEPPLIVAPAALILATAKLSTPLMQSDLEHRGATVIDGLTGLLNRRAFDIQVDGLAEQAEATGGPLAIVFGDIDHFGELNERIGHQGGDAALKQIAARLRGQVRALDHLYRYGGEEIVLVLGGGLGDAAAVAESLRLAVAGEPLDSGERVTMSFGVAASDPGKAVRFTDVLEAADRALYDAKQRGRNRVSTTPQSAPQPTDAQPSILAGAAAALASDDSQPEPLSVGGADFGVRRSYREVTG
jgi:diguanylate cyclase (GGDEF)-like protein